MIEVLALPEAPAWFVTLLPKGYSLVVMSVRFRKCCKGQVRVKCWSRLRPRSVIVQQLPRTLSPLGTN